MILSMNYMMLYPENALRCIAQMIDSVKNDTSNLSDNAEAYFSSINIGENDRNAVFSAAEDHYMRDEFLAEVNQLTSQMAVVFLNSLVETTLKNVLKECFKTDASGKNFGKIKSAFESAGLPLKSITNLADIDEIRLVSNSIKHNKTVSKPLHDANEGTYPKIGMEIRIEYLMLDQYYSRTRGFLNDVFDKLAKNEGQLLLSNNGQSAHQ